MVIGFKGSSLFDPRLSDALQTQFMAVSSKLPDDADLIIAFLRQRKASSASKQAPGD
jgi:hypothetical protein